MAILQALMAADEKKLQREQLNNQKAALDADLRTKGYNPDGSIIPNSAADISQQQNQILGAQLKGVQGKLDVQASDQAILDFAETGDATNLQAGLDKNPTLKDAWAKRGVMQIANIDWQNDNDLLQRRGFAPPEYDTPEKQEIMKRNVYKYHDGQSWQVGLLKNAVAETGALTRLGPKRGAVLEKNHEDFYNFMAGPRSSGNTAEGNKYEAEINAASEETGVPPNLLASMMNVESAGNPSAVSKKGARGLMQLMPDTAAELGVTNPDDPAQNILGGAKYMRQMLDRYKGDEKLALAAYNAGPGNVDKYNGVPPFAETASYVNKVAQNYVAAQSYYDTGAPTVSQVTGVDSAAGGRANPNLDGMNRRIEANADKTIRTVQDFTRGNANAAAGLTNEQRAQDLTIKGRAAEASMAQANARLIGAQVKLSTEGTTSTQKDLAAAQKEQDGLLADFGGEQAFFATDFSKPENYNKAYNRIVKIGKLQGTELTQKDKQTITDTRNLIALADPASKITSAQTGLLDKNLSGVLKYMDDNVPDTEKSAAMAAFRNSVRHALYGATLSTGEITSFDQAFGNSSQKLGPVLQQFKVALVQVQSTLDSTVQLTNPYTGKVLLGADQEKLTKIRSALQERIDYIEGKVANTQNAPAGAGIAQRGAPKKSLDEIMSPKAGG